MKKFLKILIGAVIAVYPVIIFLALAVFKLPMRVVSLIIMAFGFAALLSATTSKKEKITLENIRPFLSALLLIAAGIICFITNQGLFIKLYAVVISLSMLVFFGSTLFFEPTIIFRFACLGDRTIKGSINENAVRRYCRKVCIAWCVFFILNGAASAFVALYDSGSEELNYRIWSIYSGGISYVLMGLMFAVEFVIRKIVNSKMNRQIPVSKIKADSRKDDTVLCYEHSWESRTYRTWKDFLIETAKFRSWINSRSEREYLLHCEDYWYFLVSFVSLLQCKKTVHIVQNTASTFINQIKQDGFAFITDQHLENSEDIASIIENAAIPEEKDYRTLPEINAEETAIYMYTSGSTGQPKKVLQRLKEFEEDNRFVISKFGYLFEGKKLCTTVSQHHIFGLLFGVTLPFTVACPFRRTRISYPDEFDDLDDAEYVNITTPAFLKRTIESKEKLNLKNPVVFCSGGVLHNEIAEKTEKVYGIWPREVYGSTETSGIAWRCSKDGEQWTPFDNAKIWKDPSDGCLRIISPYIKNPEGFATADMVDILDDGRFILKGRSDSIVKIEEKRISLTEVENRLMETGLVHDVKVISLENEKRQFLACVIELNQEGKEKFKDQRKLVLNNYFHSFLMNYFENVVIPKKWRFVEKIPCDVQGKKHKEEIAAMFAEEKTEQAEK